MIHTFLALPFWHIYLLQLENYVLSRFWNLSKLYSPQKDTRSPITWTPKLILVVGVAFVLEVFVIFSLFSCFKQTIGSIALISGIFFFLLSLPVFPIFLSISTLFFVFPTTLAKKYLIMKAKKKLKKLQKLKVIAITGSWGKTTAKEIILSLLSTKYTVRSTPGNINTPIGIARYILRHIGEETDYFVVEMGAYHEGDIAELCDLTPPDIAIITAIGEAHLERFGSIENTIRAKFEIVRHSKKDAFIFLNSDNRHIRQHYKTYVEGRKKWLYGAHKESNADIIVESGELNIEDPALPTRVVKAAGKTYQLSILGEYIAEYSALALALGKEIGLSQEEVFSALQDLSSVQHRLQPIYNAASDILVIDDSYNGNPDGVRAAREILSSVKERRKVYITPGLVELGEKSKEIHYDLGKEIGAVADLLILIRNTNTESFEKGAKEVNPQVQVKWFEKAIEAHAAMPNLLKKGDIALFQNDLTDNY